MKSSAPWFNVVSFAVDLYHEENLSLFVEMSDREFLARQM